MVIGLTGGVATGKSLVSSELKKLGAYVIDADLIAREAVEPGRPAYKDIVNEFGASILKEDGTIDRKALGDIVFSDPEKLKKLNSMTHPRIRAKIRERIAGLRTDHGNPLIIIDVALLIEFGLYKDMEKVVVVYADLEKQLERLKKRNGLNGNEAQARIAAQAPVKEKFQYADYIINNNEGVEETLKQVKELYEIIKNG